MDIGGLFEALGAYFLLPFYAIAYYFESFINGFAVVLQILVDAVFSILQGLEAGLNAIVSFVSWLPPLTFGLFVLLTGLIVAVVMVRIVTKVLETLPGGMGGWLK